MSSSTLKFLTGEMSGACIFKLQFYIGIFLIIFQRKIWQFFNNWGLLCMQIQRPARHDQTQIWYRMLHFMSSFLKPTGKKNPSRGKNLWFLQIWKERKGVCWVALLCLPQVPKCNYSWIQTRRYSIQLTFLLYLVQFILI